jgi:transcriptional regulator with XRE-family HTH domain
VEHDENARESDNGFLTPGVDASLLGPTFSGPPANGHAANGNPANGHSNGFSTSGHALLNGHPTNGHAKNGHGLNGHPTIARIESARIESDRIDSEDADFDRSDDSDEDERPQRKSPRCPNKLQQLGEARRRQGLSVRCVAQRLGKSIGEVRAQEEEDADLTLSELYRWQSVLDVPLEELLADPDDALSPRVMMRAQMLRVMKTARAVRAQARSESEHRLSKLLINQLIEIMPELKEVAAWPTVGHRRTADELGRIAERTIPDDFMHEAS